MINVSETSSDIFTKITILFGLDFFNTINYIATYRKYITLIIKTNINALKRKN